MRKFRILTPTQNLSMVEIEMVVRSFADFYNNQTPKHQRVASLELLIDSNSDVELIKKIIEFNGVIKATSIHINLTNPEKIRLYEQSSLFFYTSQSKQKKLIPEAFSYGLPVLCIDTTETADLVDITCGVKVKFTSIENTTEELSNLVEMLYFDPEVRRILEKGALDKYEDDYSWGQRFNRNSRMTM